MENVQTISKTATLYERLGGEEKVRKIVRDVLQRNLDNPIIGHHFKEVDMEKLNQLVFDFFSMGIGGPHKYTGRDMRSAHSHLNITDDDFQRANIDTILALKENDVADAEINEIISILDSMRGDVVRS
jgi:hemoglobin